MRLVSKLNSIKLIEIAQIKINYMAMIGVYLAVVDRQIKLLTLARVGNQSGQDRQPYRPAHSVSNTLKPELQSVLHRQSELLGLHHLLSSW